jgi:hypothetical protein
VGGKRGNRQGGREKTYGIAHCSDIVDRANIADSATTYVLRPKSYGIPCSAPSKFESGTCAWCRKLAR